MKKWQLASNLAKMPILPMIKIEEKVSSMYRQHYEEKPSQVQEECDPKVYGENVEKKLQALLTALETNPHYSWWLSGTALSIRNLKLK